jgi:hypothetical protein
LWMGAGSRPGGRLQTRGSAPPDCNFRGTTLGIAALMMMVPAGALAQAVANASIHGVISDPTSAFIPLAQIKATQTDTGQVLSTLSGSDGSYVLPNLPVGPYSIEVTAPSFSGYLQSGIVLQVGNNVQVNVTLQLGTVAQELRVSANAVMVETQDTSISQVVDQRRIVDLPLNGRQATDLILLSGGAVIPPNAAGRVITTHDYPTAVGVSVSGGQINGNNYLLDGGDHNDSHSNVNLPFPFPDALQEFSVQTNGVAARYGLHPGAVINVVTKSGTNQFHGGLFEFVRNGDFNARNFFAPTQDTLRRNQFGGMIGGPVKKDKIFVFSGFQATRTRTAPPQSIAYVPTQAALSGDFSALESAGCQSSHKAVTLMDPTNGQPFPNNFISPTRFNAPALALQKLVPVSADPCGQLIYSIPNPNNENQYIGRADWLQSAKNTVFGRYFIADYDNPPIYTNNILTTTRAGLEDRTQTITLGDQYSITPTVVNAFHATFNRLAINRAAPPTMPSPVSVGVNMYNNDPHYIDVSVSNRFAMGGGSNAPAYFMRNQYHVTDDLDMVRGRHHLSYGAEVIAIQMQTRNVSNANGSFAFNGSLTNDPLADFLIGRPSSLSQAMPDEAGLRQKYIGAYVQDDFRVTKTLNVHFGVRWEPSLPEHDVAGRGQHFSLPAFIAGQKTTKYTNAPPGLQYNPNDPGIPASYANGNWAGFAPRVGLAWDPTGSGKQSIRASYGIFFDAPESYTIKDFAQAPPWGNQVAQTAPSGGFSNPYQGYPGGNPFPTAYPPSANAVYNTQGTFINLPLNLHHMYMQQWDLSYQRQLSGDWLVSATYLGNNAMHLRASNEANPAIYNPAPGASTLTNTNQRRLLYLLNPAAGAYFSTITMMDDGGTTNYNALRLSVQHRFAQHFTLLAVYTYSHCLQNSETVNNRISTGSNTYQNPYNRNADHAVCDADLRQNVTTSFVYEVPRFTSRAVNTLLGDWRFSFLVSAHPGFPYSPVTGADNSLTGVGQDRPNVVGSPYVKNLDTRVWVSPAAFVANAAGTYGNAGYNSLLGPGFVDWDANLTRFFQIRERQRFELRFEFFNLFNHTNFANPGSNLRSATFGVIQSAADPRILQFAAKYSF